MQQVFLYSIPQLICGSKTRKSTKIIFSNHFLRRFHPFFKNERRLTQPKRDHFEIEWCVTVNLYKPWSSICLWYCVRFWSFSAHSCNFWSEFASVLHSAAVTWRWKQLWSLGWSNVTRKATRIKVASYFVKFVRQYLGRSTPSDRSDLATCWSHTDEITRWCSSNYRVYLTPGGTRGDSNCLASSCSEGSSRSLLLKGQCIGLCVIWFSSLAYWKQLRHKQLIFSPLHNLAK